MDVLIVILRGLFEVIKTGIEWISIMIIVSMVLNAVSRGKK